MTGDDRSSSNTSTNAHGPALLLIDWINDLEFSEGKHLLPYALTAARQSLQLRERARAANVPVIYVNDNFGQWKSDFRAQVERCLRSDVTGCQITELLQPSADDFFILKPRHSAFFGTPLELLLKYLHVDKLIFTGLLTDVCVLFSANDAYIRGYAVVVASDCVATIVEKNQKHALEQMRSVLKAEVVAGAEIKFEAAAPKLELK